MVTSEAKDIAQTKRNVRVTMALVCIVAIGLSLYSYLVWHNGYGVSRFLGMFSAAFYVLCYPDKVAEAWQRPENRRFGCGMVLLLVIPLILKYIQLKLNGY